MKLILCEKCWDVFKLVKEPRKCSCGEVAGVYIDNVNAVVTENAISVALGNGALAYAIYNMRKLKGITNDTADREEYHRRDSGQILYAWVRPNEGPGNPHTKVATLQEIIKSYGDNR